MRRFFRELLRKKHEGPFPLQLRELKLKAYSEKQTNDQLKINTDLTRGTKQIRRSGRQGPPEGRQLAGGKTPQCPSEAPLAYSRKKLPDAAVLASYRSCLLPYHCE